MIYNTFVIIYYQNCLYQFTKNKETQREGNNEIFYIGQKGTKTNLLENLNIMQYKTKNRIINEQRDLHGHETFKIFNL